MILSLDDKQKDKNRPSSSKVAKKAELRQARGSDENSNSETSSEGGLPGGVAQTGCSGVYLIKLLILVPRRPRTLGTTLDRKEKMYVTTVVSKKKGSTVPPWISVHSHGQSYRTQVMIEWFAFKRRLIRHLLPFILSPKETWQRSPAQMVFGYVTLRAFVSYLTSITLGPGRAPHRRPAFQLSFIVTCWLYWLHRKRIWLPQH